MVTDFIGVLNLERTKIFKTYLNFPVAPQVKKTETSRNHLDNSTDTVLRVYLFPCLYEDGSVKVLLLYIPQP